MTADSVLRDLLAIDIEPGLSADGRRITVPAGRLTDAQRQAIRAHRAAIIERLQTAARLTTELLAAAARAADHWCDDKAAREQWRRDIEATPPELRADLLDHLNEAYPRRTP